MNAGDSHQATPLHRAAEWNWTEVIDLLVEAGANVQAWTGDGRTPLHHGAARTGCLEAMLVLLKHGADVNARSEDQETPLHCWAVATASAPRVEIVDSLLRSGADETTLNNQGHTAAD